MGASLRHGPHREAIQPADGERGSPQHRTQHQAQRQFPSPTPSTVTADSAPISPHTPGSTPHGHAHGHAHFGHSGSSGHGGHGSHHHHHGPHGGHGIVQTGIGPEQLHPQQSTHLGAAPRGSLPLSLNLGLSSHSLLDMLPEVVIVLDRASVILWINKQSLKQLGYSPAELIGQSIDVLIPKSVYPSMDHAAMTQHYVAGTPSNIVGHCGRLVTVQRKDTSVVDMRLTVNMVGDNFCGTLTAVEGSGGGVSDQVLALVSHETRNFLMVARGSVEAVALQAEAALSGPSASTNQEFSADEVRVSVANALEAIDHSVAVLRDLHTMSQAATQTLQCTRDWYLASDLCTKLTLHATGFGVKATKRLDVSAHNEVPANISVELALQHVEQLIMNLVANALKYAASHIAVHVALFMHDDHADGAPHDDALGTVQLRILVDDDGPGIAPADRKTLFRQAVRLRRAVDRQFAGSGLGLHLCQIFAAEHDGKVEIQDSAQHATGSLFVATLALPYRVDVCDGQLRAPDSPDSKSPIESVKAAILVVDDMIIVRHLMEKFVQRCMPLAVVVSAATVAEARHMMDDRHFDLIFTDYALPDGTGADVIAGAAGTICVCVSGSSPPSGVFDCVLEKPVTYRDIRRTLIQRLGRHIQRLQPPPPSPKPLE